MKKLLALAVLLLFSDIAFAQVVSTSFSDPLLKKVPQITDNQRLILLITLLKKKQHLTTHNQRFTIHSDIYNKGFMDYKLIYNKLVEKAYKRGKVTGEYSENHHVMPLCLGGPDDSSNIVQMTAREHFVAHRLLHRMYPDNEPLAKAFGAMAFMLSPLDQERYIPSSRAIAEARAARAVGQHKKTYAYHLDGSFAAEYDSRDEAVAATGANRQNIKKCIKGQRITAAGFQWSDEKVENIGPARASQKGRKVRRVAVYTTDYKKIGVYPSITTAADTLSLERTSVNKCLSGSSKQTKGFVFEYADPEGFVPTPKRIAVVNRHTGEIFESKNKASASIGIAANAKAFDEIFEPLKVT